MADNFNKSERSRIMAAIRGRGNKATELVLAKLLRAQGLKGWRRHLKIAGRPDFAFPKARIAIFVDGCFWHGCAKHCRMPASNQKYWTSKIARNIRRDKSTRRTLKADGWKVIRIWEHDLKKSPERVVKKIGRVIITIAAPRRIRRDPDH